MILYYFRDNGVLIIIGVKIIIGFMKSYFFCVEIMIFLNDFFEFFCFVMYFVYFFIFLYKG